MVDGRGSLIYVGKAKCLRARLLSYFRANSREDKAGRILDHTRAIVWEYAASEFAALLRELELIRRWKPVYNVQGLPGRRRVVYVCLGRKPAPYLFVARQPPADALACYGPLQGRERIGDAVRRLNDYFRLRDCEQSQKMHFADQGELFPILRPAGCLRQEIDTCSGPCAGYVTRAGYGRQVRAARAFLDGSDNAPLLKLEREMTAAAQGQAYERAAALRDKLEPIRWLADRLAWLQRARQEHSFVYVADSADGVAIWYLIHRGRVRSAWPAPRDSHARRTVGADINVVFRDVGREDGPLPADQVDSILLVAGWFRKHPEERQRTLSPTDALDLCRANGSLVRG
jgi:excinuclease ABC subunit C